jgi:endonuclease III related protein
MLLDIFNRLIQAYGPQHWWPATSRTEIVVGAILTQNTAWANVVRAMANLKNAGILSWSALRDVTAEDLEQHIRPAGTYRVKAQRLKTFVEVLWRNHNGSLKCMLSGPTEQVRARLLRIKGIGPETADAILLYAADRPTFVVDAYTARILRRHLLIEPEVKYEDIRRLFHHALPSDPAMFNEYHALLVAVGKRHCRSRAMCEGCPLDTLHHDESR